ncbi:MAG: protein kinase [Peptococcaceae bacterium]|nr:protein kinase [Peptococcaceae bacterium]
MENLNGFSNHNEKNDAYTVIEVLKESDFTRVEKVWDQQQVFIRKYYKDKSITRNLEVLLKLQHKAFPKIHDCYQFEDQTVIVEEYLKGAMLSTYVKEKEKLSPDKAVEFTIAICEAVSYLHTQNPPVIHRDIKPDNIIYTNDGMKLIDFNIARVYDPKKDKDTVFMGTLGYAPPEQFGFGQTDQRSDIYAIGMTLYFMLTGLEPERKLDKEAIRDLPQSLQKILLTSTDFAPDSRYDSAENMKRDLLKASKPLQATPLEPEITGNIMQDVSMSETSEASAIQPSETKKLVLLIAGLIFTVLVLILLGIFLFNKASVSPTTAKFNKNIFHVDYKDIVATLSPGSYKLVSITNGSYTLKQDDDYTMSGDTCTIKKEYLSTLEMERQTLVFRMNGGISPSLAIDITESEPSELDYDPEDMADNETSGLTADPNANPNDPNADPNTDTETPLDPTDPKEENGSKTTETKEEPSVVGEVLGVVFDPSRGKFFYSTFIDTRFQTTDSEYIPPTGAASWNSATNTLTLTNFNWTTSAPFAFTILPGKINIRLVGDNRIASTFSGSSSSVGLWSQSNDMTVSGTGVLRVSGANTNNYASQGISATSLTLNGATLIASGGTGNLSYGVSFESALTINSGSLTATGSTASVQSFGIRSMKATTVSVNGGTMSAQGNTRAIEFPNTTGTVSTGSTSYTYWTNTSASDPGGAGLRVPSDNAYSYNNTHKYVRFKI